MEVDFADLRTLERHLANLQTVRLIGEKLAAERLAGLLLTAPDQAAERVLSSIQLDAWSQREEIETVMQGLRNLTRGTAYVDEEPEPGQLGFPDQVESLAEVKRDSAELFAEAARDCPDRRLSERLERLAAEDREQALILSELADRARMQPLP